MNEKPHTHKIEIERDYLVEGALRVHYGDQRKRVIVHLPFFEARLKRVVRKTIAKHDKESQRAPFAPHVVAQRLAETLNENALTEPTPPEPAFAGKRPLTYAGRPTRAGGKRRPKDAWGKDALAEYEAASP